MDRRAFLGQIAVTAAAGQLQAQPGAATQPPQQTQLRATAPFPIIDTHIHLFDQTRPQGAPYTGGRAPGAPPPTLPALPPRYRSIVAEPLGIVGAIAVEASPWIEDNLWLLEVAQQDPIMVGVIGNLEPNKPEFPEYLERYHRNPLFLGIRYGNLWNRDIARASENPAFIDGLKLLAQAGLVLDTANPRITLLDAVIRITDRVPDLRVVVDHLPNFEPTLSEQPDYEILLAELRQRPQVYVKLTEIVRRVNGQVSMEVSSYRDRLDYLIGIFGEDRILFGSDWPNSDGISPIVPIVNLVEEYFATKPMAQQEKYFWRNSVAAYRWVRRDSSQPMP
jgi:predicted TIM-barrel fold metal-dependent hydrolase